MREWYEHYIGKECRAENCKNKGKYLFLLREDSVVVCEEHKEKALKEISKVYFELNQRR